MDGAKARQLKFQELERDPLGREEATRQIHDGIILNWQEQIQSAYAQFLTRYGAAPVVIVADLLYDEFGEALAVSMHGGEFVDKAQMEAFNKGIITVLITARHPFDVHAILSDHYGKEESADAIRDPGPGKFWAFVASMDVLSAYQATIPL